MKKLLCCLCCACLLLTSLPMTGCAGSFFAEEGHLIEGIVLGKNPPPGHQTLIFKYTDGTEEEIDIEVVQGEKGEEGTGIAGVTWKYDKDNRQTGVTLTFTDKSLEPVTIDIPDGRSVVGVHPYEDVTGKSVIFEYSDGSSQMFALPKGDKGNGITSFTCVQDENDKSVTIDIVMDDGRAPVHVFIPGPAEGRGVSEMIGGEAGSNYYIDVTYTDGTTQTILFKRPTKWFNGTSKPSTSVGEVGDFFFDTSHDKIYQKEEYEEGEYGWSEVASFNMEKYDVNFDLNDDGDASMPVNTTTFKVERGSYFSADGNGDIPIPTRPGYTFKGWYRKKTFDPATMSPFTDFTPVFSDLTLYAIWEKQ